MYSPETRKRMSASNAPFSERCPIGDMEKLIRRRQSREFMKFFKCILSVVRQQNYNMFHGGDQNYFTQLFDLFFQVLQKPSFQFEPGDEMLFTCGGNITNLLTVTPHKNADECIKKIVGQSDNMAKLLLLYSPRSRLEIPVQPLFDANAMLASLWYSSVWNWADTYIHPVVKHNYGYFLENANPAFQPFDSDLICGYFRCTYVDNLRDRILKDVYCKALRRYCAVRINNRPNPKSIALVSAYWNGRHAVYRAFAPYVEELAREYDITLINLGVGKGLQPETSLFKKVVNIEASPTKIDLSTIVNNDFQLAYFPDVGMSQESVYLANMRIAPIQCMGTGHPVTSAATCMDYFISGAEVETTDQPEANYSERLVLLPGLSVNPVKPDYRRQNPAMPEEFIINCPWMHMKINYEMTQGLRKIYDTATRPVRFAVFPGCGATRNSSLMATIQDFAGLLPETAVRVEPDLPYPAYMLKQEQGRFTLHSYPFGGGTTAVDALVLHKPLVVLRGRHEYNRFAASLLNRIGLGELVADSLDRWVEICVRLIDDEEYLADVTRRVAEADLDTHLFRVADAGGLRRAFGALIKNDAVLRKDTSRKPVAID